MTKHNHVAIVVAVILHQVIGFLWYSDFLFVSQWMAGLGKKPSDFDCEAEGRAYLVRFRCWKCGTLIQIHISHLPKEVLWQERKEYEQTQDLFERKEHVDKPHQPTS